MSLLAHQNEYEAAVAELVPGAATCRIHGQPALSNHNAITPPLHRALLPLKIRKLAEVSLRIDAGSSIR